MKDKRKMWFKAKKYGWGWVPSTKEGWLIVAGYLLFVSVHASIFSLDSQSVVVSMAYFFDILVATTLLIFVCYKTGEPPRWRWGK